jgi:hypothetical protein
MTERVSRISSHYVVTELAAFPFASESALRASATHLCPKLEGKTGLLWRGAEQVILGAVPSISLDEFVARRDALWFQPGPQRKQESDTTPDKPLPLLRVLRRLASRTLEVHGSLARPRLSDGEFVGHGDYAAQHARGFWKWLRLTMPPDLLLSGLGQGVLDIETLAPALDRRLRDDGFAEIHLHYGAGIDFSDLWAATCSALFDAALEPRAFASPGAALDEGNDFADWLLRACLTRYLMASFLEGSRDGGFSAHFECLVHQEFASDLGLGVALLVRDAVAELRRGQLEKDRRAQRFYSLRQAFMAIRLRCCGIFSLPEDAVDPVVDWSELRELPRDRDEQRRQVLPKSHARRVELDFLARAFAYLESKQGKEDLGFAECLWQSVRIRSLFYRHVTQRPLTPGLPWFLRTFKRLGPGKSHLREADAMRLAGRTSGAGRGLRSLELRTSPKADMSSILDVIEAARDQLRSDENPDGVEEVGLVLHLIRDRGDGMFEGRPRAHHMHGYADPSRHNYAHGARYSEWYRMTKQEVFAFASVLRHFPEHLDIIRGVDLCADEAGIPTWVVKPLLRYLHEIARYAAQSHSRTGHRPALALRTTIHAGEDWLHLLGGLRHIDEARSHFDMRSGDRFGHGLALAVDPMEWSEGCGPIAMPRELRLFDLAWVWSLRERVDFSTTAVEAELRRLMGDIFGHSAGDAWLAGDFINALHDEQVLHRVGYPSCVDVPELGDHKPRLDDLVRQFLADPNCFRRGRTIIHVDPRREGEMITAVQDWLRRELDSTGIIIEVNPSSNFLTQQLPSMWGHPVWRLHAGRHEGLPELPVVIGSDDPIIFATSLPEEYQLMHDALVLSGRFTNDEADRWLDETRRNSMTHRWTIPVQDRLLTSEGCLRAREEVDLPP